MIEYKVIPFEGGATHFEQRTVDALNALGKDGWQVVQTSPTVPVPGYGNTRWYWTGLFQRAAWMYRDIQPREYEIDGN